MTRKRSDGGRVVVASAVLLAGLLVVGATGLSTTGGFLGFRGDTTDREVGHRPPDVPSQRVLVTGASLRTTDDGAVGSVVLVVESETDIDLSNVTITWLGPREATTLTYGDGATRFDVVPVEDTDDSAPVLDDGDRFRIVLNASAISDRPLAVRDEVDLKFVTVEMAVTHYSITVPDSFADDGATTESGTVGRAAEMYSLSSTGPRDLNAQEDAK